MLEVPLPGRPAPPPGSAAAAAQAAAATQLDALVASHDVVFLLTDTRESRWLPTVAAAAHAVPCLTLALGVDALLVTRSHAFSAGDAAGADPPRMSCYFCADVVAPSDGSAGRAMDEACTISRPGLAPIACALAAELVVALLHHPQRFSALDAAGSTAGSALGAAPQQLRLDLHTLSVREGAARAFAQCAACSAGVLGEYLRDRAGFLGRALRLEGPAYIERLSGLAALKEARGLGGTDEGGNIGGGSGDCGGGGGGLAECEEGDWAAC